MGLVRCKFNIPAATDDPNHQDGRRPTLRSPEIRRGQHISRSHEVRAGHQTRYQVTSPHETPKNADTTTTCPTMAKENEATPERSAPATPLRRGIRCASGAGVALGLVLVSTCCPGFSLRHTWGRLSEQYRLGADGHGREPGVPLSSFRDGSRAFSPSASQGSPR